MTDRLKIGLVLDDGFDSLDGVQQYMLTIADWLRSRGHEVSIICGQTRRDDINYLYPVGKNIAVKFNGNGMSMPLPCPTKNLRSLLERLKLDVIHIQMPYSPFMGGRLISAADECTAVVGTFHILPYDGMVRAANKALAAVSRKTSRRIDTIMATSEPTRQFAHEIYRYESVVIPNPFDFRRFDREIVSGERPKSGRPKQLRIVYLGRLVERKGAMQLLRAAQYLFSNNVHTPAFVVHIGGRGPLNAALHKYVEQNNLGNIVRFDGFIDEKDKPAYLADADIVALPSVSGESFGISVLEALASARGAVLAGNNPGYASIMTGFPDQLVDPNDTPQFATALARYLNDEDARSAAARQQHTYAREFDINIIGKQIEEIYASSLRKRRIS